LVVRCSDIRDERPDLRESSERALHRERAADEFRAGGWPGMTKPRMLRLTGRLGGGRTPSAGWADQLAWPAIGTILVSDGDAVGFIRRLGEDAAPAAREKVAQVGP
jgi:hypothetical protein